MNNNNFFIIFLCAFFLAGLTITANDFAGGFGTEAEPYLVETAEHLSNVRNHLDAHFKQIADIDLSGYAEGEGWEPIGRYYAWNDIAPFLGTYDGNGYTIINLFIDRPDTRGIGLFGYLGEYAELTNMSIEGVEVSGYDSVGGLVGMNFEGAITNSYATGALTLTGDGDVGGLVGFNKGFIWNSYAAVTVTGPPEIEEGSVGGLVGLNWLGNITNCYAAGSVSGEEWVGGLVGCNERGTVTDSYATGEVSGNREIGGLVGFNRDGTITSSYATGNVSGEEWVGGLVGHIYDGGTITSSYAAGNVSGEELVGGLVGFNEDGTVTDSYATGEVSGNREIGGLVGRIYEGGTITSSYYDTETTGQSDTGKGIPKTTAEMKQQVTFEGWDFEEVWGIVEETTYPYLRWVITGEDYQAMADSYHIPALYMNRHDTITVTFRNTGTQSWEKGTNVYLGAVDNNDFLVPPENWRMALEHDVNPAQLHAFAIPVHPQETGIFTTEWRMLKEGEFWFGEKFSKEVEVTVRTEVERALWQMFE